MSTTHRKLAILIAVEAVLCTWFILVCGTVSKALDTMITTDSPFVGGASFGVVIMGACFAIYLAWTWPLILLGNE